MEWSHGKFFWNELMTRNIEAAKKFYADTIGWTFEPMPMGEMTYWLANMNGEPVAGMFEIGAEDSGVPESWMSYIAVDNVDARVTMAVRAGAKIMKPAFEVPGVGRFVILTEPGGANVGWITPANE